MKDLAFYIKDDKSLWERMDYPNVGDVLLVEESYYDGIIEDLEKQKKQLAEVIARNLVAWDTSKDKREGLLPEVYLTNRSWYKRLTGEEYVFHKALKKFNIG
ncbi:hypothetical protein [Bacillus gobiensis]|uniref:Uncharacterized protein n=1 Tax=Bacillus gobiensis TaxID=1441095 RepID=A0A0M4FHC3_9BACI|nr:hypothetical protein [Bacillus gobiensis]ALC80429.1 hypothetical protein AM592_01640 [Bacillus gobiensis]